jgi:drug/metabolite transporter (DMT)-like permease
MLIDLLLLVLGNVAASASIIFIKASEIDGILFASYRMLVAALVLTPAFILGLKNQKLHFGWNIIKPALIPGIILAVHFITWIFAARITLAANATLIVCMVPLAMPVIVFFMMGDRVKKSELVGTVIALLGVVIIGFSDSHLGGNYLRGDFLAFVSMVLLALYMAYAKKNRQQRNIWIYLVPLYYIGGIVCLLLSFFFTPPHKALYSGREILMILGTGIVSTVIGHTLINYGMRRQPSQIVSLILLSQFIFAGILAFFIFGEIPSIAFYPAVACITAGTLYTILKK